MDNESPACESPHPNPVSDLQLENDEVSACLEHVLVGGAKSHAFGERSDLAVSI